MARREKDRYLTPDWAVKVLLDREPGIRGGLLLDPSSGDGRMAAALAARFRAVHTNDIDPVAPATTHKDATAGTSWIDPHGNHWPQPSWVVTNPPFVHSSRIAWLALQHATRGVALLLRCTWLEPCRDRQWLAELPPTRLIILPRISFTGTGSDSAGAWWMIWERQGLRGADGQRPWVHEDIQVVTRAQGAGQEVLPL